jgi:hypothetical protein
MKHQSPVFANIASVDYKYVELYSTAALEAPFC